MASRIVYNGQMCSIICDDDYETLRFLDRDHIIYLIERDKVKTVLKDDGCIYYVKPGEEAVTSFYYDEASEDAKCLLD